MSVHLHLQSSPIRNAVSFSACSVMDTFVLVPFISASISFSVGTNGRVSFLGYSGGVHWISFILQYSS